MISKILRGDYGLAKTFWLGLAINAAVRTLGLKIQEALIWPAIQNSFILDLLAFGLLYAALILIWQIGVWRSGNRYVGPRLWRILSRWVSVLITFVYLAAVVVIFLTHLFKLPLSELLRFAS